MKSRIVLLAKHVDKECLIVGKNFPWLENCFASSVDADARLAVRNTLYTSKSVREKLVDLLVWSFTALCAAVQPAGNTRKGHRELHLE